MGVGGTAYINDQLGLHAVRCHDDACEEGEEGSVSLHICECACPACSPACLPYSCALPEQQTLPAVLLSSASGIQPMFDAEL